MTESKGLENLIAWQKAMAFARRVYSEVISGLPAEEKWAMANQLRRAVTSVPANIAEGYGRYYFQENIRFCYIARGSLDEAYTYLRLAKELEYIPDTLFQDLNADVTDLKRIIHGYVSYLKKSKPGQNEPGGQTELREALAPYVIEELDDSNA